MPVFPAYRKQSIDLYSISIEANQLTGFYMRATLAFNGIIFFRKAFLPLFYDGDVISCLEIQISILFRFEIAQRFHHKQLFTKRH